MRTGHVILVTLLALAVAVGMVGSDSDAETIADVSSGDFTYDIDMVLGTASVTGCTASGDITVPAILNHDDVDYPVVSLRDQLFRDRADITGIHLPGTILYISSECFRGCTNLVSVQSEVPLQGCNYASFKGCIALTAVDIREMQNIPRDAFSGCTSLTSPDLSGVRNIHEGAFSGCTSLTSLVLPDGLEAIGEGAFSGCTSLASVSLPAGLSELGTRAFSDCPLLSTISISDNPVFQVIDNVLLSRDGSILHLYPAGKSDATYVVPSSVVSVRPYAFQMSPTSALKHIVLPEGMSSLLPFALSGSGSVVEISLPESLSVIGDHSVSDCVSLSSIDLSHVISLSDGSFKGCSALASVEFGTFIERIPFECFRGCGFETVAFPAQVHVFQQDMILGCSQLVRVDVLAAEVSEMNPGALSVGDGVDVTIVVNTSAPHADWSVNSHTTIEYNASPFTLTKVLHGSVTETLSLAAGTPLNEGSPAPLAAPVRGGYTFNGWVGSDRDVMPVGDYTVTAAWVPNYYVVSFHTSPGTGHMRDYVALYDVKFRLPSCQFENDSYVPIGWSKIEGSSVPEYVESGEVMNLAYEGMVDLYAVWDSPDYEVLFDPNGGEGSMVSQGMKNGFDRALSACEFDRLGYKFVGWALDPESRIADYSDQQIVTDLVTTGTITLYAVWSPIQYTLYLDPNGSGGQSVAVKLRYDEPFMLTSTLQQYQGYTCALWCTNKAGTGTTYQNGTEVSALCTVDGGSTILYPMWAANIYTIVFDPNGGEGTMDVKPCIYGNSYALPYCTFTMPDHTFKGWSLTPDGEVCFINGQVIKSLTDRNNATVTLYAIWEKDPVSPGSFPLWIGLAALSVVLLALIVCVYLYKGKS